MAYIPSKATSYKPATRKGYSTPQTSTYTLKTNEGKTVTVTPQSSPSPQYAETIQQARNQAIAEAISKGQTVTTSQEKYLADQNKTQITIAMPKETAENINTQFRNAGVTSAKDFFFGVRYGSITANKEGQIIVTRRARTTIEVRPEDTRPISYVQRTISPSETISYMGSETVTADLNKAGNKIMYPNYTEQEIARFTPRGEIRANTQKGKFIDPINYMGFESIFDIGEYKLNKLAEKNELLVIPSLITEHFVSTERTVFRPIARGIKEGFEEKNPLLIPSAVLIGGLTPIGQGIWATVKEPYRVAEPVVKIMDYASEGDIRGISRSTGEIAGSVLLFEGLKLPVKSLYSKWKLDIAEAESQIYPKTITSGKEWTRYNYELTETWGNPRRTGILAPETYRGVYSLNKVPELQTQLKPKPYDLDINKAVVYRPSKTSLEEFNKALEIPEATIPQNYWEFINNPQTTPAQIDFLLQAQGQLSFPTVSRVKMWEETSPSEMLAVAKQQAEASKGMQTALTTTTETGEKIMLYSYGDPASYLISKYWEDYGRASWEEFKLDLEIGKPDLKLRPEDLTSTKERLLYMTISKQATKSKDKLTGILIPETKKIGIELQRDYIINIGRTNIRSIDITKPISIIKPKTRSKQRQEGMLDLRLISSTINPQSYPDNPRPFDFKQSPEPTTPNTPTKFKFPLPKYDYRTKKNKKKSIIDLIFNPKYVASVEAGYFGIKGKKPSKAEIESTLLLRPLVKINRRR